MNETQSVDEIIRINRKNLASAGLGDVFGRFSRIQMKNKVCLLTTSQSNFRDLAPFLTKAGLSVWKATSVSQCLASPHLPRTLCVIADLPTQRDIDQIVGLRTAGFDEPVILISNCAPSAGTASRAHLLDVLAHPVEPRDVLTWIECICIANLAANGRLKRAA